jgi:hypothetical protein
MQAGTTRFVVMCLGLGLSGHAMAQDSNRCTQPFAINEFIDGMNAVDDAVASFDMDEAMALLDALKGSLPCTPDRVHPNHLVRFSRQKALSAFFDQDELEMSYWGRLALIGNPKWPETLAEEHPVREALTYVELVPAGAAEGATLVVPKGGAVMVDGVLALEPAVPLEQPHFVQLFDKKGTVIGSTWQDGAAYPEPWVVTDGKAPSAPTWYKAPRPTVDPTVHVVLSEKDAALRAKAQHKAERDALYADLQRKKVQAREQARADKRQADVARAEEVAVVDAAEEVSEADPTIAHVAPTEWVDLEFDTDPGLADIAALASQRETCDDLLVLEPFAMLGRLDDSTVGCLERRLRLVARQTSKDKISRVLMANAWAQNDQHKWEAMVRRHLKEIDRSDVDLCYIFARHLATLGAEFIPEAIRWSHVALNNSLKWEGAMRVQRIYNLHRINAVAAKELWVTAEGKLLEANTRETRAKAGFWRNQTKSLSREWLAFSTDAGLPAQVPFELCIAAAGTQQYCQTVK